jgi:hypothetical protein
MEESGIPPKLGSCGGDEDSLARDEERVLVEL